MMPRKVTAWACKFRCGRKTDTVKKRMVEHEARCRMNPDQRACPTCMHWTREEQEFVTWYCDIDMNCQPEIGSVPIQTGETPFVYNCPNWEQFQEGEE
jgi:hypothetical protein